MKRVLTDEQRIEHRRAAARRYAAKDRQRNPEKVRARIAAWRAANQDRVRELGRKHDAKRGKREARDPDRALVFKLKHLYGLSRTQYDEMHEAQGGVCAICNRPERIMHRGVVRRLVVDHDHANGRVRGLLCQNCNAAIGMLDDDPALVASALRYLQLS